MVKAFTQHSRDIKTKQLQRNMQKSMLMHITLWVIVRHRMQHVNLLHKTKISCILRKNLSKRVTSLQQKHKQLQTARKRHVKARSTLTILTRKDLKSLLLGLKVTTWHVSLLKKVKSLIRKVVHISIVVRWTSTKQRLLRLYLKQMNLKLSMRSPREAPSRSLSSRIWNPQRSFLLRSVKKV